MKSICRKPLVRITCFKEYTYIHRKSIYTYLLDTGQVFFLQNMIKQWRSLAMCTNKSSQLQQNPRPTSIQIKYITSYLYACKHRWHSIFSTSNRSPMAQVQVAINILLRRHTYAVYTKTSLVNYNMVRRLHNSKLRKNLSDHYYIVYSQSSKVSDHFEEVH